MLWKSKKDNDTYMRSSVIIQEIADEEVTMFQPPTPPLCKMRKVDAPACTALVRRSTRATRYNGFKPSAPTDIKKVKSKVKSRKLPFASGMDGSADQLVLAMNEPNNAPPPTPLSVLQNIGVMLCGVPPKEVSPKKLLAKLQEEDNPQV